MNQENCQVCGRKLSYFDIGQDLTCVHCGETETANICCPDGHYVCDSCHGQGLFETIRDMVKREDSPDPLEIAEKLMGLTDKVPMLGCENAWIAAGAFMTALRNQGTLHIADSQIDEVLNRTRKQAVGGYCGLTGICGIAPAIGACFSVILGASCPKDRETSVTMKAAGAIVEAIAEETGPCCCKNFVRTALVEANRLAQQYLGVSLPVNIAGVAACGHVERHPHGCRKEKCRYYLSEPVRLQEMADKNKPHPTEASRPTEETPAECKT